MKTQKIVNILKFFSSRDSFTDRAVAYQLNVAPNDKRPHSEQFIKMARREPKLVQTIGMMSDPFGAAIVSHIAESTEVKVKQRYDQQRDGFGGWMMRGGATYNTAIREKLEYLYRKTRGSKVFHITRADLDSAIKESEEGRASLAPYGVDAEFNVDFARKISLKLTKHSVSAMSWYPNPERGTLRIDSYDNKNKVYRSFFMGEMKK